jgi:predicted site-specific integrase-resolvase
VLEAAKKAGVHRTTLIRWLKDGHVSASHTVQMPKSGHIYRAFTDEDIEKIRQYHKDHYWEIDYTARIRYKRKPR